MEEQKTDYSRVDIVYKVVLLGECGAGKSSIAEMYVNKNYQNNNTSTIGVDFFNKIVDYGDKRIKIQVWDTAGQEKFYNLICSYFRDCCLGIIVFDVTNYNSFKKVDYWVSEFEKFSLEEKRKPIILVGSKIDAENLREVSRQEGAEKAVSLGCEYIECSAKSNFNIEDIFEKTTNLIYSKIQEGEINPQITRGIKINSQIESFYLYREQPKKDKCCVIL